MSWKKYYYYYCYLIIHSNKILILYRRDLSAATLLTCVDTFVSHEKIES